MKITRETCYKHVDYRDAESFIAESFGFADFNIVGPNDTEIILEVTGDNDPAWLPELASALTEGEVKHDLLHIIFDLLASQNKLEKGNYIVSLYW